MNALVIGHVTPLLWKQLCFECTEIFSWLTFLLCPTVLDLKQTLRVLQKTYFHLLHAPNPYVLSLQRRISPLSLLKGLLSPTSSDQDQQQNNQDPVFYREVDMSDLPSQYAEEVETFRHILDLPEPRETMPRSSTQQELWPRGPSAMLTKLH